jgi:hypothetical protein
VTAVLKILEKKQLKYAKASQDHLHVPRTVHDVQLLLQMPPPKGRTPLEEAEEILRRMHYDLLSVEEQIDIDVYDSTTRLKLRCASKAYTA